jgi:hypothetical protein
VSSSYFLHIISLISSMGTHLRASNQTHIPVILRSAATKNLRCFAFTPFRLSMIISVTRNDA